MRAEPLVTGFSLLVIAYFLLWNLSQLAMGALAGVSLLRHHRRRTPRDAALTARLTSLPLISIAVPARNEGLTIVESVRALLSLEYSAREIVVVNDGSTDDTLARLTRAFQLVAAPVAFEQSLRHAAIRGVYRSVLRPDLIVLDKISAGSKADAVNAGINAAAGELVLVIDADTMLEPDALTRAALPFLEDETTIAVGGYVAVVNGSRVEHGRVTSVQMPRSWWARFQIVEYMRSFLLFRAACASLNALPLISGAFGLFRRASLIAVGGLSPTAIGEDLELTLRLQAYYRSRRQPIRIDFVPIPVCWTQVPEDFASLSSQRRRWRRGLLEAVVRHRVMIGNPRYGVLGVVVLPYMLFIDGLGPLLECSGYVLTTVAVIFGVLQWEHYRVLLAVSLLFGMATTLAAIFLSDIATRRYLRGRDLMWLLVSVVFENAGFRQINSWWGCVGSYEALIGTRGWGRMERKAF